MITFFTTAKPFLGHNSIIQRNALKSWTLLDLGVEIILFGDDSGASDVSKELGLRHEPLVERNEFGTIRIDYMFTRAQAVARHGIVCYSNCVIILLPDFCKATQRIKSAHPKFLATSRRWNMDISIPIDFSAPNWQGDLKDKTLRTNRCQTRSFIDYLAFSRGFLTSDIPPLAVGRIYWDNWMWNACESGKPVVHISPAVIAVHQNHDYRHHPQGRQGVYSGEEAARYPELAGGFSHLRSISDVTHILSVDGLEPNYRRRFVQAKRSSVGKFYKVWFALLDATRPLRHLLDCARRIRRQHSKERGRQMTLRRAWRKLPMR